MIQKLIKKRNQKGFTLVELLIVIAIIGILAAIAIPQFNQYRNRAHMAATRSDAKNAYTAVQAWISDNVGTAIPGDTSTSGSAYTTYTSARTSPGVTVTIAATTGDVTATNTAVTGSYIVAGTGLITDTLAP